MPCRHGLPLVTLNTQEKTKERKKNQNQKKNKETTKIINYEWEKGGEKGRKGKAGGTR
jgi:hypothetical protein